MKNFILLNIFLMALLSLMFLDFTLLWFLMEINNFLFLCYLSFTMNNKKMIFFYYLIQLISSLMLIFALSLLNIFMLKNSFMYTNIMLALMMKLGIPPLHMWMPIFSIYCPWNTFFFMLTIQKFIPFYMISFLMIQDLYLFMIIIFCSVIPPLQMMNLLNFKKLLSYSSINQSSWLILLINFKNLMWMFYFMYYTFSLLILIIMIKNFNMKFNYYNKKYFNNNFLNFLLMFSILNFASMPPFSMFYMKWFSTMILIINSNLFFIIIIMLISSIFMSYIYINMMMMSMYFLTVKFKFMFNNTNGNYYSLFDIIMILLMMFISIILLMI